jgi:hypothetical protein
MPAILKPHVHTYKHQLSPSGTHTAGDSCHLSRTTLLLLLPWFLLLLLELLRMAGQP